MLFSNCHVKFIFPMALAVADSALGLILFCFHSVCCFMMPEKILVFKQIILFRKIKFGGEIERICRTFFRGFLGPVNGPKNSILNWVSNLNVENKNFFLLFKNLSFLLLSLIFIGSIVWYAKSANVSHLFDYKQSLLQNTTWMSKACKPYLHLKFTGFSLVFTRK